MNNINEYLLPELLMEIFQYLPENPPSKSIDCRNLEQARMVCTLWKNTIESNYNGVAGISAPYILVYKNEFSDEIVKPNDQSITNGRDFYFSCRKTIRYFDLSSLFFKSIENNWDKKCSFILKNDDFNPNKEFIFPSYNDDPYGEFKSYFEYVKSPEFSFEKWCTHLQFAILKKNVKIVKLLLAHPKISINYAPSRPGRNILLNPLELAFFLALHSFDSYGDQKIKNFNNYCEIINEFLKHKGLDFSIDKILTKIKIPEKRRSVLSSSEGLSIPYQYLRTLSEMLSKKLPIGEKIFSAFHPMIDPRFQQLDYDLPNQKISTIFARIKGAFVSNIIGIPSSETVKITLEAIKVKMSNKYLVDEMFNQTFHELIFSTLPLRLRKDVLELVLNADFYSEKCDEFVFEAASWKDKFFKLLKKYDGTPESFEVYIIDLHCTLLHLAILQNDIDIVKHLLHHPKISINKTVSQRASVRVSTIKSTAFDLAYFCRINSFNKNYEAAKNSEIQNNYSEIMKEITKAEQSSN